MKFGAHVSIRGGVENAVERAKSIGCETFQIFSKNQRQWKTRPLPLESINLFKENFTKYRYEDACIHASYLINLASPPCPTLTRSREAMIDEMQRAAHLGIPYVVVHSGAHKGMGTEKGIRQLIESVQYVLQNTQQHASTILLLENSAGQGTTLGASIDELAVVRNAFAGHPRLGFCIDTCHLFAAGYDFLEQAKYEKIGGLLQQKLGIEAIPVLHFNDSARPLGSRVDNHAKLGQGEIGLEPIKYWVRDERWVGALAILETPGGEENYAREIKILKSMRDMHD
ncbi:MAG: deoxyribonuclease IV [Calditrichaeota bacterium]|nr:MAG: deoxyribonuclease IV [Calditrichota bacterium]